MVDGRTVRVTVRFRDVHDGGYDASEMPDSETWGTILLDQQLRRRRVRVRLVRVRGVLRGEWLRVRRVLARQRHVLGSVGGSVRLAARDPFGRSLLPPRRHRPQRPNRRLPGELLARPRRVRDRAEVERRHRGRHLAQLLGHARRLRRGRHVLVGPPWHGGDPGLFAGRGRLPDDHDRRGGAFQASLLLRADSAVLPGRSPRFPLERRASIDVVVVAGVVRAGRRRHRRRVVGHVDGWDGTAGGRLRLRRRRARRRRLFGPRIGLARVRPRVRARRG